MSHQDPRVQRLFERVADAHSEAVRLVRWRKRGTEAVLVASDRGRNVLFSLRYEGDLVAVHILGYTPLGNLSREPGSKRLVNALPSEVLAAAFLVGPLGFEPRTSGI